MEMATVLFACLFVSLFGFCFLNPMTWKRVFALIDSGPACTKDGCHTDPDCHLSRKKSLPGDSAGDVFGMVFSDAFTGCW